jgi:periplasmic protein TonB
VASGSPGAAASAPLKEKPAPAEAVSAQPTATEDATAYPSQGFRKPAEEDPGCVSRSVRLPRELASTVTGPIAVRFEVGPYGSVGTVEIQGRVLDSRIATALKAAVRSCRFIPGADQEGQLTRLWLVMTIRFAGR